MKPALLISYAQAHEDIILARIFEPWENHGHWIDVGAGHPRLDSVTMLFSEFGWTGVNVEPLSEEYQLLESERTNDINLQVAIGRSVGEATIFAGPPESRGTSTMIGSYAASHNKAGAAHEPRPVKTTRLQDVIELAPWPIDFIKIDVEGMEAEVLASTNWHEHPAHVVIVESVEPNSYVASHSEWEMILFDAGYEYRFFDGLNRYYTSPSFDKCHDYLWFPAVPQDHFLSYSEHLKKVEITSLTESLQRASEWARSLDLKIHGDLEHFNALKVEFHALEAYAKSVELQLAHCESKRIELHRNNAELSKQIAALVSRIEFLSLKGH